MEFLFLVGGLVVLVVSGDYLVKFASGIALKLNIPPVIVGLTIVSIGTSAPEIMASVRAALQGNPGITVGNVIGSNIANLALILGVTALIHPVRVDRSLMRSDWPVMLGASGLMWWFARDLVLSTSEGMLLVAGAVAVLCMLYFRSRNAEANGHASAHAEAEHADNLHSTAVLIGGIAAACTGLYYGAEWFVDGARRIAINNGVTDHLIGLTVVAFGTSVPELVASGIAAWNREPDLALGNLIGSNIFNIFLAAGISASIIPVPVEAQALECDFWWMTGIALVVGAMMAHRAMIHRWKGAVLLLIYFAYIGWIGGAVAAVAAI